VIYSHYCDKEALHPFFEEFKLHASPKIKLLIY